MRLPQRCEYGYIYLSTLLYTLPRSDDILNDSAHLGAEFWHTYIYLFFELFACCFSMAHFAALGGSAHFWEGLGFTYALEMITHCKIGMRENE
jgi:hypothetical protein